MNLTMQTDNRFGTLCDRHGMITISIDKYLLHYFSIRKQIHIIIKLKLPSKYCSLKKFKNHILYCI